MNLDKTDDYIETYTGKRLVILDPQPEQIDIEDIAHSLSMQCRYTGHVRKFYSVAEHSYWVSELAERSKPYDAHFALWGLLHDATEAYLADIASPVKQHLSNYKEIENRLAEVIAERFRIPLTKDLEDYVKFHDIQILRREAELLMPSKGLGWKANEGNPHEIPNVPICGWYPEEAKEKFLKRFEQLMVKRILQ